MATLGSDRSSDSGAGNGEGGASLPCTQPFQRKSDRSWEREGSSGETNLNIRRPA